MRFKGIFQETGVLFINRIISFLNLFHFFSRQLFLRYFNAVLLKSV